MSTRILRSSKRKALATVKDVEVLSINSSDDDDEEEDDKIERSNGPSKKRVAGKRRVPSTARGWKTTTTTTTTIHSALRRSGECDFHTETDEDEDEDEDELYIEVRKETTTTTISRRRRGGANLEVKDCSDSDNKENTPRKAPGRVDVAATMPTVECLHESQPSGSSSTPCKQEESPSAITKTEDEQNMCVRGNNVATKQFAMCKDSDDDDDDLLLSDPFSFQPVKHPTPARQAVATMKTPAPLKKGNDSDDDEILSPMLKRRESRRQKTLSSALEQSFSMDESEDDDCPDSKPQKKQERKEEQRRQKRECQGNLMVLLDSDDEDDLKDQMPTFSSAASSVGLAASSGNDAACHSDTLDAVFRARQARQALSAAQQVDALTVTAQAEAEAEAEAASSPFAVEILSPPVRQASVCAAARQTPAPKGTSIYVALRCQMVGAPKGAKAAKDRYNLRIQSSDVIKSLHDSFREKFIADNSHFQIERLVLQFDGCALQEQRTIQSYELEDDDLIDVLVNVSPSTGGGKPTASHSKDNAIVVAIRSNMSPASTCSTKNLLKEQCNIRVRCTDPVQRLLESYSKKFAADNPQLHLQRVVLQFDGESLAEQRTLRSYGIEDEDLIDAVVTVTRKATRVTRSSARDSTAPSSTREETAVRSPRGKKIKVIVETSTDDSSIIVNGQFSFRIRCTDKVQKLLDSYKGRFASRNPQFLARDIFLRSLQTRETLHTHRSLESYGFNKDAVVQGVVSSSSPSTSSVRATRATTHAVQLTLRTHAISSLTAIARRVQDYSVSFNSTDKIQCVMARYRQLLQGTLRIQNLLIKWKGQALEEGRTLQSYSIGTGEVMDVMVSEMAQTAAVTTSPPASSSSAVLSESARKWLASRGLS